MSTSRRYFLCLMAIASLWSVSESTAWAQAANGEFTVTRSGGSNTANTKYFVDSYHSEWGYNMQTMQYAETRTEYSSGETEAFAIMVGPNNSILMGYAHIKKFTGKVPGRSYHYRVFAITGRNPDGTPIMGASPIADGNETAMQPNNQP